MTDIPSKPLSRGDRKDLSGYEDVVRQEPDQIYPPTLAVKLPDPPTPRDRSSLLREKAEDLIARIKAAKDEIDRRCSHLATATGEPVGSTLYQAMWRVFQERTTTITYDHYKRALELQQKLASEDAQILRSK